MKKTYNDKYNSYHLDADGDEFILHRIGSDSYSHIRHADVPAADVDNWEEIPVTDIPARTTAEYDAEVERLIARRYSYGKEIEVNRERDLHPDRYAAYLAYIDQCKAEAKATKNTTSCEI